MKKTKVQGLAELRRNCRRMARAVGRAAPAACLHGAEIIAAEARDLVHVDSGVTRDAIKVQPIVGRSGPIGAEVVVDSADFPDDFHALYEEFGTSKMVPRPFLTPAFESKKAEASVAVGAEVLAAIESNGA